MKIWLYGQPFSGKTHFASQFPNAKVISTDGNAEYLFKPENIIRVKNYQELNRAIEDVRKNPPEWLVIDTTGYLLDYLRFYFLDKNKVDYEGDIAYKGHSMLRSFYWESITTIANLCDNIIFISHEDTWQVKNKFGREITYFSPTFEEKLKDKMMGLMTVVARTVKESNEKNENIYKINIGHIDEELGGTRLPLKATQIDATFDAFINNIAK